MLKFFTNVKLISKKKNQVTGRSKYMEEIQVYINGSMPWRTIFWL